jgi:hypothetical protein
MLAVVTRGLGGVIRCEEIAWRRGRTLAIIAKARIIAESMKKVEKQVLLFAMASMQ